MLFVGLSFLGSNVTGDTHFGLLRGKPLSSSCIDTDYGWVGSIKGTCTDVIGGKPVEHADSCKDAIRVNEYYCAPSNLCQKWEYACKLGQVCRDGACVAK